MPLMRTGTVNFTINKIPVIRQGLKNRSIFVQYDYSIIYSAIKASSSSTVKPILNNLAVGFTLNSYWS